MDRLLTDEELARVAAPIDQAWSLPPRAYTSAGSFDREREAIFRRDWICVARAEQVAEPGDYLSVQILDQPVVVTHDASGEIRAMANVCLHRAMPLVEGSGNGKWMVCPYHLWSYGLDGALHTAPMMEDAVGFDLSEGGLPQLALEIWEGFIFVSLANDPEPLAVQLGPLSDHLSNYRFGDLVTAITLEFDSPWNWKILVENFMEAYHHIGPHRETFQVNHPAKDSWVEDNHGGPWALLRMPGNGDVDESAGLPFLSGLAKEQRSELIAVCVFPTLLFAGSGTGGFWYEVVPHSHESLTLRIHALVEPSVLTDSEMQDTLAGLGEGVAFIHNEDIAVNVGPWRGLNAPLTEQGRLSVFEAAIWQLNQIWLDRVQD